MPPTSGTWKAKCCDFCDVLLLLTFEVNTALEALKSVCDLTDMNPILLQVQRKIRRLCQRLYVSEVYVAETPTVCFWQHHCTCIIRHADRKAGNEHIAICIRLFILACIKQKWYHSHHIHTGRKSNDDLELLTARLSTRISLVPDKSNIKEVNWRVIKSPVRPSQEVWSSTEHAQLPPSTHSKTHTLRSTQWTWNTTS